MPHVMPRFQFKLKVEIHCRIDVSAIATAVVFGYSENQHAVSARSDFWKNVDVKHVEHLHFQR